MPRMLLLIGLDGASFNVIEPMVESDRLPTINRLLKDGTHGILKSVIPPVTCPACTL
jgi:predicted AlkP superfamily phosphohydrolase/phosphomutase